MFGSRHSSRPPAGSNLRPPRSSRGLLRFALVALLAIGGSFAANVYAQPAPTTPAGGANGTAPKVTPDGLFTLIAGNLDPVFWVILICSIFGLTLIIQGFVKNRRSVLLPEATINHIRELISQRQFKELIEYTESDPTFVSKALNPALKRAPSFASMKEAMETAIGEQTADQFRRIEFLNIIGNLGPLLGLLGTVLGMIGAFSAMKAAGPEGANPSDLAGGISKALTHTFLGLALAVPCLACFGILRTMVDRLTVSGALIAEELLLMIKPADSKAAAPAVPGRAAPGVPAPPRAHSAPIPAPPVVPAP